MESITHFLALIMSISVLVFWYCSKKLNLYSESVFRSIIFCSIILTFLDFINCNNILHSTLVDSSLKYNISVTFYIFVPILYSYLSTLYLLVGIMSEKTHRKLSLISMIAPILEFFIVLLFLDKEIIVADSNILIANNFTFLILSIFAAMYWIAAVILMFINRKKLNKFKIISMIISIIAYIIGTSIQFLIGSIGGLSISSALCIAIYLIINENPLIYTNKNYDCFKDDYLLSYLNRLFELDEPCYIYSVSIETKNNLFGSDNEPIKDLIKNIIKYNKSKKGCHLFISDDLYLTVTSTNISSFKNELVTIENYINEYLSKNNLNLNFVPIIVSIENSLIAKSAEALIGYFNVAMSELNNNIKTINNNVYIINQNFIKQCEDEKSVIDMVILALNEDRVKIFIQPIYCVQKDAFISGEVLVRIMDREGNIIPPFKFIPIAEKRGIIGELDNRVLEKTCQLLSEIDTKDLGVEFLDVNLSVVQCQIANYSDKIIAVTKKYNIAPNLLNFEITESGLLNDIDTLIENIKKLTDYGFGFSLDDFGNGESNLNYLVDMPVSNVKLDMTMIRAYFENPNANKIVKSITNISHNMHLKIVAEGVENNEQLNEMKNINVDYIQGYCFYKPMPSEEYKKILYDFARSKKERKTI